MRYPQFYVLLLLLLIASSLRAAVIREDFARMVDYVGWQLIDAYMQDYVRLRPDMAAEKEGYLLFRKTYNSTNYSQQRPPNSETVRLYLISHDWRNAGINLYADFVKNKNAYQNDWSDEEATRFLQRKISAISPEALGAQRNSDYMTLQATKARLIREVARSFTGATPEETTTVEREPTSSTAEGMAPSEFLAKTEQTSDTTPELDTVAEEAPTSRGFALPTTSEEERSAESSGMLSYAINPISLGAFALLLLLLLYLLSLLKRMDNRLDRHSKRIEDLTARLFLRKDPVTIEDVDRLKSQVTALRQQVEKLSASPPPPTHRANPAKKPPATEEEYYLSTPNSDGTFNTSSMSSLFRPSASVYKFRVVRSNGSQWAEFTVANDYDAVKDALSSPGSYLDPVCESVNSYFPGAKKIVNEQPGRAIKQGDKWVVKPEHKARIRYE